MIFPKEIDFVTEFLLNDVQGSFGKNLFLEQIDLVLQEKASYREAQGNVYRLEIRKDVTRVVNTLLEEENIHSIETEELKQIIEVWSEITKEK